MIYLPTLLAGAWKGAMELRLLHPFTIGSDLELPPGFDQHILVFDPIKGQLTAGRYIMTITS